MTTHSPEFNFLKEGLATDLVCLLSESFGMSLEQALDALYSSRTYEVICDPRTRFYLQSPLYVFSFLKEEIETGRFMPEN